MKVKREKFLFKAGKYVAGDVLNVFTEKDAKKIKSSLSKVKTKGGFNKKLNLHYFKSIVSNNTFTDYIEKGVSLIAETSLVIIPEELAKRGRLSNCRRFTAKNDFNLTYLHDDLGIALYLQEPNTPSPFMMLVQTNEE